VLVIVGVVATQFPASRAISASRCENYASSIDPDPSGPSVNVKTWTSMLACQRRSLNDPLATRSHAFFVRFSVSELENRAIRSTARAAATTASDRDRDRRDAFPAVALLLFEQAGFDEPVICHRLSTARVFTEIPTG